MVDGGARSALVIIAISTIINKEGERTKEEGGRRTLKMVNGNHKLLSGARGAHQSPKKEDG
jgi:hypothetical protein